MPIQAGDVKLVKSAVSGDQPESGGPPTSTVIQDNQSNEIFKDISESDRARGRVNMTKVHVSVQTPDTDTYLGANAIVAKPPEDPNVSVTLFTTNSVYDTRQAAQARLEAYLNKGPEWAGFLFENHIAGQRSVQLFQRVGAALPRVGQTLVLVLNEGASNEQTQYVRATRVSSVDRAFTYDSDKDYQATVVTLELSDPLRYDFKGTPANRQFLRDATATKVRDTVVADAGSYVGVQPLAAPVSVGDFTIRAKSIYSQLVPSSQTETPIPASSPQAQALLPVPAAAPLTYTTDQNWTSSVSLVLPSGTKPGSVKVVVGGVTITDKAGTLVVGDAQVGTIDYANGILSLASGNYSGTKTITYCPAAFVQRMPQSADIPVTAESRRLTYSGFLSPLAAPGTLSVSYQVQKRWYSLADGGDGVLRGYDATYGVGTYRPDTGSYVLTLGALPDVGSAIVLQWGVPTQETAHPSAAIRIRQTIDLPVSAADMIDPAFLSLSWTDGATQRTATANSDGTLSGDAVGTVDTKNATVTFSPNVLPQYGTTIDVAFDRGAKSETVLAHPSRNGQGQLAVNAGGTNLRPGSVTVEWNTLTDLGVLGLYTLDQLQAMGLGIVLPRDPIQTARDNGAGKLMWSGTQIGTVNYTTGDIVFQPDVMIRIPRPVYSGQQLTGAAAGQWRLNYSGIEYVATASLYPNDETGQVKIRYYSAQSATRERLSVKFAPQFPLVDGIVAPAVPGSVTLVAGVGAPWGDSGTGVLREYVSGAWVQRGTINYVTNSVTLTAWPAGLSGSITRASCSTTIGENVSSSFTFRTAAAPIAPSSLSIQFSGNSGGTMTVTADAAGNIVGANVTGKIDYESGLVRIGFGSYVTAAGNEREPWYDASRVGSDGKIFKPAPVAASTVRYAAVAYSYLPLNASLIGIDPVRLPSDGRVPIFRAGSMVVIGNTKTTGPLTPSDGQVINLGRERLSRVVVRDAAKKAVYTGYSVDLEAGKITFTDVASMTKPVTIEDRIEDMAVVSDVQISGELTFTRRITHAYPAAGTYVSSALEYGDKYARVSAAFSQATWDGTTWLDAVSGTAPPAKYNTTLAPIQVTNIGASTERWALKFTNTTTFQIIGEHVGVIGNGDINTDCAPINPATGQPYFKLLALGWGSGWAAGNIFRFNTEGALCPVWAVRTVQPGPEAGVDYSFDLLIRGDVDRP